jgi:hypothetical protein
MELIMWSQNCAGGYLFDEPHVSEAVLKAGFTPTFIGNETMLLRVYPSYPSESVVRNEIQYDDMVYCVELKKFHTLITRRNGKVVVSGNCRCQILYVPKGFSVTKEGYIAPKKSNS